LSSSPAAKLNEDLTLVVPQIPHPEATTAQQANKVEEELVKPHVEALPETPIEAPVQIRSPSDETPQPVKVYEDPFVDSQQEPKPAFTGSVLEDKPVNEDAANLPHPNGQAKEADDVDSLDKANKNARLLDSGISKIKLKSLEVHGFRKLQSLLRDSKTVFTDDKFQALLLGLFQFLEDPLSTMPSDKAQDVKAQVLTTIKLLLKRERDNFKPHVSKCLESLLETRSRYEGRAHIISGLELLADELVTLGDPPEIVVVLGRKLQGWDDSTPEGCRALSTGLHVLKAMLEKQEEVVLSDSELALLVELTGRCLESTDSGVRMDAVQLCVALHACAGEERFWDSLKDIKEDPKSLITYYIIKRQRENGGVALA
jgi:CLIP-associating protein 1/2